MTPDGTNANQMIVWSYPKMKQLLTLDAHQNRVLCTALDSRGTSVCSVSADETIQFWNIWRAPTKKKIDLSSSRMSAAPIDSVTIR